MKKLLTILPISLVLFMAMPTEAISMEKLDYLKENDQCDIFSDFSQNLAMTTPIKSQLKELAFSTEEYDDRSENTNPVDSSWIDEECIKSGMMPINEEME